MKPTAAAISLARSAPFLPSVCVAMLLLTGFAPILFAQSPQHSQAFSRFTSEDGLANNTVLAIEQDARGFIWFGADDGLSQFDGKSFKNIRLAKTTEQGEPNQAFIQLAASKSGRIFFRTGSHIGFCNSNSLALTIFPELTGEIRHLALCEEGEKEMLYAICSNTLYKLELLPSGGRVLRDSIQLEPPFHQRPLVVADKRGNFWLIESGKVGKVSWETRTVSVKATLPSNAPSVYTAMLDADENLWIGGWIQPISSNLDAARPTERTTKKSAALSLSANLILIPTKGETAFQAQFPLEKLAESPLKARLAREGINYLAESRSGNLWIGTRRDGAFCLLPASNQGQARLKHFIYEPNDPLGLSGSRVTAVLESRNGSIWFGFESFGVNQLPILHKPFYLLRHYPLKANSLSNNYIRSIFRSSAGDLWVCTQFGGLNRVVFNPNDFTEHKITRLNQSGKFSNCWAIAERRDGKLIVGFNGPETGLFLIDPKTDASDAHFQKIQPMARTYVIKAIGDDRFLIGGEGLWLLENNRLNPFGESSAMNLGLMNDILLDRNQTVWVAADSGLFHFDLNGRLIQKFTTFDDDGVQKPVRFLSGLIERRNGEMWCASKGDGLFRVEKNRLKLVSTLDEAATHKIRLPSTRCYGILEDDENRLWASCDGGLVSFAPELPNSNYALRHYQQSDGLQGYEFNRRAFFKDTVGHLYFGGTNGLNYFNPKHIDLDTIPFQIAIRAVKLFDRELDATSGRLRELNHDENFLSFTLSELSFNPRSRVKFRYQLNGGMWQESSSDAVSFVSLESGEYELVVKGVNSDGIESVNSETARFRIKPPFYKTTWAYLAYCLAFATGVIAFIQLRTRRIRNENIRLEQLVDTRTRDLAEANRFKTRLMEIASHDLRNPLQSIFGFARLIGETDDLHDSKRFAQNIEKSSKQMVNLVEDLLERKAESEWQLARAPTDIAALILEAVEKWKGAARAKAQSLTLVEREPNDKVMVSLDERRLGQVLDNLLSNAVKYTHSGGRIRVSISTTTAHCVIRIEDNGQGLSEADLENLFQKGVRLSATPTDGEASHGIGLSIAKELVLQHGGKLWAESQGKGKGAAFLISLPL
jgi:signal transduction histidine kinase/ligand-binding sensor domain-containing protein